MNLRRNSLANIVDTAFFMLGVSLISRTMVVPPLVSRLTDSKVAIGLAPALSVWARCFHNYSSSLHGRPAPQDAFRGPLLRSPHSPRPNSHLLFHARLRTGIALGTES